MVRIKRHRDGRSHQEMKNRRKPNIPELVYKFLVADEAARDTGRAFATKCHCCGHEKRHDEVVNSADSPRISGKGMSYKGGKNSGRVSKSRGVKRLAASKDLSISFLQKCVGGEGMKKARKYIKKALDFGVESGYLIPSDPTYKVLRVSSALMKNESYGGKIRTYDRALSREVDGSPRDTPIRLEDLQVQEQGRRRMRRRRRRARRSRSDSRTRKVGRRRRRRRRRRSRSRSRSRSRVARRLSSPQNPEEIAEDNEADDYEMDGNDPKNDLEADEIEREPKITRSNPPDEEQSTKKAEENVSDLSVDEDETDDDEEKKRDNKTKS